MKFNVTRVAQDGFHHHQAFAEVQDSLCWALASLGHEVAKTFNWFSEHGEKNIILGSEQMADWQRIPRNSVIFNLEQPSHPSIPSIKKLSQGLPVWDFSFGNLKLWEQGLHVPIGYVPILTRIPKLDKDIDVLFYGWPTPRRTALLDQLKQSGLNVVSTANCYGGGRDNLIARSKVVLNAHHDGRDMFEIVRCSYLMANSACVLTEPSSDDADYEDLRPGLATVPYRLMVDYCHSLVNSETEREKLGSLAFGLIRNRDFTQAVASALEHTTFQNGPSRPIQHAQQRQEQKQSYLQQGRELSKNGHDPRVAARFERARQEGDMRDFAVYLKEYASGEILEIGVRDGASTAAFLAGLERNDPSKGHLDSIDVVDCAHLFAGHPQWHFHQLNSKIYLEIVNGGAPLTKRYDIVLVDGDHSRAGIKNDLELAWKVTNSGAKILVHDITPERTCEEFGGDWPSIAVGEEYRAFCERMGCKHEELQGYSGLGVITK